MEGDDAAVTGVALDVVEHVVGGHPFGVVAGDKVPHDDAELAGQPGILVEAHPAMGRTHEVGLQVGIGFFYIVAVFVDGVTETADMVVRVIADAVSFINDTLVQLGVFPGIVANHEKGCLDAIALQHVENEWRGLWYRTVIEGQVHRPFVAVHTP